MKEKLDVLPDDEARVAAWYEDNWHPNAAGHALYAKAAWAALRGQLA